MPGVKKVVAGRRHRRRRGRRHLVAGQDGARCAADRVGRGPERRPLQRADRRDAEGRAGRPARPSSATRPATSKRRSPARRKRVEAVYGYPYQHHATMEPMNATALCTTERCEVWTATQNAEAALATASTAAGPADRQVRRLPAPPRRRLRPAVAEPRLRAPGRPDRQADARHAGQADLVARGGHAARALPSGHPVQAARRARRRRQPRRAAHADLRPVDPGRRQPAGPAERHATRPPSRASTPAAPKACSATPSRTC